MNVREKVMTGAQAAIESVVGVGTALKIKVGTEIGRVMDPHTVRETRKPHPMGGVEGAVMTMVGEGRNKEGTLREMGEAQGMEVVVKVEVPIVELAPREVEALKGVMGSRDPMSVTNVTKRGISRESALKQGILRSAVATREGMIGEQAVMKRERQMRIGESVYKVD